MSDQNEVIQKLVQSIAKLEGELSGLRSQSRQPSGIDPAALKRGLLTDPAGTLARLGFNETELNHVDQLHVARVMGDAAPPQLKALAQSGQNVLATSQIQQTLEALSRRLDESDNKTKLETTRQSFKALAADKTKYPHLAKAFATNPALFEGRVTASGSAEDLAKQIEAEQAQIASIYGFKPDAPPASNEHADNTQQAQSQESKPAVAGTLNGDVPQIPQTPVGVFDASKDHEKLKNEILSKFASQLKAAEAQG